MLLFFAGRCRKLVANVGANKGTFRVLVVSYILVPIACWYTVLLVVRIQEKALDEEFATSNWLKIFGHWCLWLVALLGFIYFTMVPIMLLVGIVLAAPNDFKE